MKNPTPYVTVSVSWGEKKAHLYSTDSESWEFHKTEAEARDAIAKGLASGDKMMALLTVEGLYKAKPIVVEKL